MDKKTAEYILIELWLSDSAGRENIRSLDFHSQSLYPIYKLTTDEKVYAIKVIDTETMADSEAESLQYLYDRGCNIPKCYGYRSYNGKHYLVMDFIESVSGINNEDALFSTLKELYSNIGDKWGWNSPNFIGAIYQENTMMHSNFTDFWWKERIQPLAYKAQQGHYIDSSTYQQIEKLIFQKSEEWNLNRQKPRLVHGDLWSGNVIQSADGKIYLVDPSISYSHIEQDIAMSQMFGGFPGKTWIHSLQQEFSIPAGIEERIPFWQLYPVLVHVLLFGDSYLEQLKSIVKRYS